MRILAISHACLFGVYRAIYRELGLRGHEVALVTAREWTEGQRYFACESQQSGDPQLVPLALSSFKPRTYLFDGLIDFAERFKPDLVLLDNDPISRLTLQLGAWCRRTGTLLCTISCENLSFDIFSSVRRRGLLRGVATALPKLAVTPIVRSFVDHVFTISEDGRRLFQQLGFRRVTKIPLGFDPRLFRPDPVARSRIRAAIKWNGPLVAYFGRVTPEKGIHVLVNAIARIPNQPWRLLLDKFVEYENSYAGDVAEKMRRLDIESRIIWCNPDHAAVGDYMNAADVVVVPSTSTPRWKEQYGRVAQEAMACGTLVIASRSGTLPELVCDGALLFDEGDEKALAALLAEVMSHPARFGDIRARGLARAQASLSVKRQAELMNEVFEGLHRRRAGAPATVV